MKGLISLLRGIFGGFPLTLPSSGWLALVWGMSFFLLAGCERQEAPPGAAVAAPPPRHPAMLEPAASKASPRDVDEGELPAGHPPIGGKASEGLPSGGSGQLQAALSEYSLTAKLPAGWIEEASASKMRLATIRLPRVEGDAEDGELSVVQAQGSEEANIERWRGQFKEKPEAMLSKKEASGVQVTMVEMEGTFTGGGGPMAGGGGAPKPGTKLLGAIVRPPQSDKLLFFKAWGPKATMERWKPSFEEFLGSLQPAR